MSRPTIFIDGEAGTTGLQIRARLEGRDDIKIISIDPALRKDDAERKRLLNSVDVAVLCLHDDIAKQAVSMVENPDTKILDASSAHRIADGWTFGFPELTVGQAEKISQAKKVSNPGCYATGAIALLRPLREAKLIPDQAPISVRGISGYSGGGRQLIEAQEGKGEHRLAGEYKSYSLGLDHKHVLEMQRYGLLDHPPIFEPAVAKFEQGMLVSVPLHLWSFPEKASGTQIQGAFSKHYEGSKFVKVMPLEASTKAVENLSPQTLNNTNQLEIFVFENPEREQVLLVSRLDNLGKGASGAAVQNLDLMLGIKTEYSYSV